jgi:hypothetical protein
MTPKLDVVAMCGECKRGYVSMNNPQLRCHACGGLVERIGPFPNEWPYVKGPFVRLEEAARRIAGRRK